MDGRSEAESDAWPWATPPVRRGTRLVRFGVAFLVGLAVGPGPAAAHPGHGNETDLGITLPPSLVLVALIVVGGSVAAHRGEVVSRRLSDLGVVVGAAMALVGIGMWIL
jgi:hypothetical protein